MEIIGVFSGKGGVGKTTIASNLAVVFSKAGKRVCVVDCNVTASHLGLHFNFHLTPLSITHVLNGRAELGDVAHNFEGVSVVPAPIDPYEAHGVDLSSLKKLIKKELVNYDFVILDTAPGFGREMLSAAEMCEKAIIVSTPDIAAVTDAVRGIRILSDMGVKIEGIVLNKVFGKKFELSSGEVETILEKPVIAEIPFSLKFLEALSLRIPLVIYSEKCLPSLEIHALASRFVEEKIYPELGPGDKIKIFLEKKLGRI